MENNRREELKDSLRQIHQQINGFDNKASYLIAVMSITLTISLALLGGFNKDWFKDISFGNRVLYIVIFALAAISSLASIILYVCVIFLRKGNKKLDCPTYYKDVVKFKGDKVLYEKCFDDYLSNEDVLLDQIFNNSKICDDKHRCLVIGTWLLGIATLFIVVLVILYFVLGFHVI